MKRDRACHISFFLNFFFLFSCFELCLLLHNNFSFFAFRISSSWTVFIWDFQYIDWFLKKNFTLTESLLFVVLVFFLLIFRFGFSLYCHFWYIHANLKYCHRFFFLFNFTFHMIQFIFAFNSGDFAPHIQFKFQICENTFNKSNNNSADRNLPSSLRIWFDYFQSKIFS